MPNARPQSYLALAVATLAVTLAAWWAWDTFTGDDDTLAADRPAGSYLPPDEYPPPDPAPEPAPPLRAADEAKGETDEGRPPLTPPEVKPPVLVAPARVEEDAGEPDPVVLPEPDDETRERKEDLRSGTRVSRLLGGVARPNERATTEIPVRPATAWIGTPASWVANLASQRRKVPYVALDMEAPRHPVEFEPFYIDRFELPNSQYAAFLRATAEVLYRTSDQPDRTLVEITQYIVKDAPRNLDLAGVTTRQLYQANLGPLLQAFAGLVVKDRDDVIDDDATFEAIKDRIVPGGVDLRFYDRAPPAHWPNHLYDPAEIDHPVRHVSIEDATAFALYRGRFVPTELQWEYAARGRTGADWPWGADGSTFDERVNGGFARTATQDVRTVSVYQFATGASWVGAFQMVGNVSEWTSSFLEAYPGGGRSRPGAAERDLVVRGGSAFDQERYVMRPAFRGWLATDPDGAPAIEQQRAWTGIRTARYGRSFRTDAIHSRVPVMHFRGRKYRRLEKTALQDDVFAGFEGLHRENFQHVVDEDPDVARRKPRSGVKTLVVQPFAVVSTLQRGRWAPNTNDQLTNVEQLQQLDTPVLFGLVHTDVHLVDTWHSSVEPFNVFTVPGRLAREDVPPGTYFLASIQGVPALMKTDATDVWYLSNRAASEATLNVLAQDYPAGTRLPRIGEFRLRGADRVDVDITVPMHASAEPGYAARLVLRLRPDERETRTLTDLRVATGPQ